jgi:SanA protein
MHVRIALRIFKIVLLSLFFCVACCVGILLSIYVETNSSIYSSVESVPTAQTALVLGASIRSDGTLSAVLQERADAAYALYAAKKVSKILVSGDNSTLQYDEVYPVGKYLLAKGVPTQDIFLDYAGFDTYSSMYRAEKVFGVSSVIIVSQRFHLPRALFIARALGIHAVGIDAGAPGELYVLNTLREIPASLKAVFDVISMRVPKYLGQSYPVSGDGTVTWVGSREEMIYFK